MQRCILLVLMMNLPITVQAVESTCYGTTKNGRLENSKKLPAQGKNYVSYSTLAAMTGRTYVHSKVYEVVVSAYQSLQKDMSTKKYKYAETGFEHGGKFRPHKTHQNGLSVDFMTPVINQQGESDTLPSHVFNKFGYSIEFDKNDQYDGYSIDYEAMAAHIVALQKASVKHGVEIWRVIFDPKLQPKLFKTRYANFIKNNIQFSKKRSWVRHDEHYHVDFKVKCKSL